MKNHKYKIGLTLVEILIVIGIIAILAAMVIGIAARIDIQGDKQLTENTFALLEAALGQFRDYGYNYESPYDVFDFPLDCNDFSETDLETTLEDALLGVTNVDISGDHKDLYSGSEAMYFFLSRVPESRQTLDKIDKSLITSKGDGPQNLIIDVDDVNQPLFRVIDPWGETLRYDYYDETKGTVNGMKDSSKTFPIITSAGPDKQFGSDDDIASR